MRGLSIIGLCRLGSSEDAALPLHGANSNYFRPIGELYLGEVGVQLLYTETDSSQQLNYWCPRL